MFKDSRPSSPPPSDLSSSPPTEKWRLKALELFLQDQKDTLKEIGLRQRANSLLESQRKAIDAALRDLLGRLEINEENLPDIHLYNILLAYKLNDDERSIEDLPEKRDELTQDVVAKAVGKIDSFLEWIEEIDKTIPKLKPREDYREHDIAAKALDSEDESMIMIARILQFAVGEEETRIKEQELFNTVNGILQAVLVANIRLNESTDSDSNSSSASASDEASGATSVLGRIFHG